MSKQPPDWYVIKTEIETNGQWDTVYLATSGRLTADIHGATRYPSLPEASRALHLKVQTWADTKDEFKWRARVVGLRVKKAAAPCV